MAIYLKIDGIRGPVKGSLLNLPPVVGDDVFEAQAFQIGFSADEAISARAGTADLDVGVLSGSAAFAYLAATGKSAALFLAVARKTQIPKISLYFTAPPTGGLAQPWLTTVWEFEGCMFTRFQTSNGGDSRDGQELAWLYRKLTYTTWDDPSAGVLGASTTMTWDVARNTTA